jgi:hypothetical protein
LRRGLVGADAIDEAWGRRICWGTTHEAPERRECRN